MELDYDKMIFSTPDEVTQKNKDKVKEAVYKQKNGLFKKNTIDYDKVCVSLDEEDEPLFFDDDDDWGED